MKFWLVSWVIEDALSIKIYNRLCVNPKQQNHYIKGGDDGDYNMEKCMHHVNKISVTINPYIQASSSPPFM